MKKNLGPQLFFLPSIDRWAREHPLIPRGAYGYQYPIWTPVWAPVLVLERSGKGANASSVYGREATTGSGAGQAQCDRSQGKKNKEGQGFRESL